MPKSKVFILLPDGVGLRNFAFTKFYDLGIEKGYDVVFWNNTPFDLKELGFQEIKINNPKNQIFTDLFKNARKHIELNLNIKRENDKVYHSYRFPFSYKGLKNTLKSVVTQLIIFVFNSKTGLKAIRWIIKKLEQNTAYYKSCKQVLEKENPDLVFCTNQRTSSAIAPILAAQKLKIPTISFIFSWDNLPKATMVIETDYYFVWSQHMKKELLHYYSYINEHQIYVTGTPQFEPHFDSNLHLSREDFFKEYQLDPSKKYICYSGDDITTSPNDPFYLENCAKAIQELNERGYNLGILFRRCPVDYSDRFDKVLNEYKHIIVSIAPKWLKKGTIWNTILPTKEDNQLLVNTIKYTEFVVNLGSSMAFDAVCHEKPCIYINYDDSKGKVKNWSVKKIYNYVHFRSMPSKKAVWWLDYSNETVNLFETILKNPIKENEETKKWFEKIATTNPENASNSIWQSIQIILDKNAL